MLGSITPLGERARGSRWSVTYSWHLLGSALGGGAVGATLGAAGSSVVFLLAGHWERGPLAVLGVVAMAGFALDARLLPYSLPSPHRQVRQDWLAQYRGWFYGFGFGLQLGAAFLTVIATAAVYSAFVGAFLSGSILAGAAIGAWFGVARALPLALVRPATTSERLELVARRFLDWAPRAKAAAIAGQALAAVAAALVFVEW